MANSSALVQAILSIKHFNQQTADVRIVRPCVSIIFQQNIVIEERANSAYKDLKICIENSP